jgi:hypothetical protein
MKLTREQAEKRLDEIERGINTGHMSLEAIEVRCDELRRHIKRCVDALSPESTTSVADGRGGWIKSTTHGRIIR